MKKSLKIILSGGGTGGHIYPAIAIANEIKKRMPDAEFLFVGALGKMEMQKVPIAGYKIEGLDIRGFNREKLFSNFSLPFKVFNSLRKAKKIIKKFQPDFAIGTGGYASGPTLWAASKMGVSIYLQEQNSFPGYTNKILAKKAQKIFTAYSGIQAFPEAKVFLTGNPVRAEVFLNLPDSKEAKAHFGLNPEKPVVFSMGGSQGARAINKAWLANQEVLEQYDFQLLWQVGKNDFSSINQNELPQNVKALEFIYEMNLAYAAADIIVSRAGAGAISELALVAKPVVLIPLPTAAEDHQTKNAQHIVNAGAGWLLGNQKAEQEIAHKTMELLNDQQLRNSMSNELKKLAKPDSTKTIVNEILKDFNA